MVALRPRHLQTGLTIIELLVSLAIGAVLLTAVSVLFVQHHKIQTELDKTNRLIDNGRYALELLSDNLRLAGFYGEFDATTIAAPGTEPDACETAVGSALSSSLYLHVQGFDATDATTTASRPSCIPSGALKAGSDILVIRRAGTTATAQTAILSGNTTRYIQGSRCEYDTTKSLVDTNPANLIMRGRDCTPTSTTPYTDARRLIVELYFVSPFNVAGDNIPTLKKVELQTDGTFSAPIPLVEGIEFLQVDYGIDTPTVDGAPDSFVQCDACTIAQWASVVTTKIQIVARNIENTRGYRDPKTYNLGLAGTYTPPAPASADEDTAADLRTYRRHAYTQSVRLTNPASRRE